MTVNGAVDRIENHQYFQSVSKSKLLYLGHGGGSGFTTVSAKVVEAMNKKKWTSRTIVQNALTIKLDQLVLIQRCSRFGDVALP